MVRKNESTEDSKPVARDLKKIYQSATVEEAELALEDFAQAWDEKYPTITKQWRAKWTDIITLFDFPPPTSTLLQRKWDKHVRILVLLKAELA